VAEVHISAASNAADRGLRALADLAAAAHGSNYRVIGGHMVHILGRVYPTTEQVARVTADADAGMDPVVARPAPTCTTPWCTAGTAGSTAITTKRPPDPRGPWPSICWCPA